MLYAVSDLYLFKLSSKLAGPLVAQWTLLCNCLNWFVFYCATRTLTNTCETALTVIGLYHYPWSQTQRFASSLSGWETGNHSSDSWSLLSLSDPSTHGSSCGLQPCRWWSDRQLPSSGCHSALVTYGRTGTSSGRPSPCTTLRGMYCSLICWSSCWLRWLTAFAQNFSGLFIIIMLRVDKVIYGDWTFVPFNFLYYNVFKQLSHAYGKSFGVVSAQKLILRLLWRNMTSDSRHASLALVLHTRPTIHPLNSCHPSSDWLEAVQR